MPSTAHDQQISPAQPIEDRPVAMIMSSPVVALPEEATMNDALRALAASGLRHLVIVGDDGGCTGLLGDRLVAAGWAYAPAAFPDLPISAGRDAEQPFVARDATIADAARMMRRCGGDAVVVVDALRRPVGIVTAGDIMAVLAKPHRPPDP